MSQSVLVTGGTGLLGRQIFKAFNDAGWQTTGTGFSRADGTSIRKLDLQDESQVVKLLEEVKPQVIVASAAQRQPDAVTKDPEAARRLNVTSTKTLAKYAAANSILLIYISTDYVFPGQPEQAPFKSTDKPEPTNAYGQSKLDGEQVVLETSQHGQSVILRVPVLYGETVPKEANAESAVNVLMDALWKSQKEKVMMDDYAIRYPTNTADVARVCLDIAKLYISARNESSGQTDKDLPRILQFSSEDRMTKYEIVQKFAEIMDLPMDNIHGGGGGLVHFGNDLTAAWKAGINEESMRGAPMHIYTKKPAILASEPLPLPYRSHSMPFEINSKVSDSDAAYSYYNADAGTLVIRGVLSVE